MPFRLAPRRPAPICRPDRAGTTRMAWTAEDRRKHAPAIQEVPRQGMIVRLVRTTDALDPQPRVGRERVWSTLTLLQASWHLARDGCAWRRLPAGFPPFTTVRSRLRRWRELAVLDRALAILVARLRLARGRKRRPTAAIIDTRSVRTGPQRGPRGLRRRQEGQGPQARAAGRRRGRPARPPGRPGRRASTGRCARWRPTSPPTPRRGRPGSTAASPGRSPRPSSTATASPSRSSGSGTARASGSRSGAGRRSRPSAASSATAGRGWMTS